MLLIRCTNVFFQGRLSRHITSPFEKTRPESWPRDYMVVRQLRSGSCHYPTAASKCNVRPSRATANLVGGKACSPTKGGVLRYKYYTLHLSPIRMRKKYTRVNILRCVFILRCANQPESKFKLRSHGFYRQEYFCR